MPRITFPVATSVDRTEPAEVYVHREDDLVYIGQSDGDESITLNLPEVATLIEALLALSKPS